MSCTANPAPGLNPCLVKVCGRCRGRLALFGTHNVDGKLKKPRAATGFSLFVKERYAEVKKALPPGTKQQEVMKVWGAGRFAVPRQE